jgi:hypothetical protein
LILILFNYFLRYLNISLLFFNQKINSPIYYICILGQEGQGGQRRRGRPAGREHGVRGARAGRRSNSPAGISNP